MVIVTIIINNVRTLSFFEVGLGVVVLLAQHLVLSLHRKQRSVQVTHFLLDGRDLVLRIPRGAAYQRGIHRWNVPHTQERGAYPDVRHT